MTLAFKNSYLFACALFLSTLLPLSPVLAADTIDVNSSSGVWINATGTPVTQFNNSLNGINTSFVQWGISTGTGQSGYQFAGNAPVSSIPLDTPFALGTFTHYNYDILANGGTLTSVQLSVSLNLGLNSISIPLNTLYDFNHNETPNIATPINNPINNDIVTLVNNSSRVSVFDINGVSYTLTLLGFADSVNSPLFQAFSTVEQQNNSALLIGEFSRTDVLVPEPSTYLLLGTLLFVVAVRQKKLTKA